MAAVPCICNNEDCRTIYFLSNFHAASNSRASIIEVPVGKSGITFNTCPKCGTGGSIPPGRYALDYKDNGTDNPARLLDGPVSTKNILEQAQNIMNALRQSKQEQAEVIAALETISPAIAKISRETAGSINYKEWAGLIMALLALLIAIQQAYFKKEDGGDIKREYIDHLLKENEEFKRKEFDQAVLKRVARPAKTRQQQPPIATPLAARKQNCPCGSGKKFKRCHGST